MHRNPETDGEFIASQRLNEVQSALAALANNPRLRGLISSRPEISTTAEQLRTTPYDLSASTDKLTSQKMGRHLYTAESQESHVIASQQEVENAFTGQLPSEGEAAHWVDALSQEENRAA